jgi:hypothetical protein
VETEQQERVDTEHQLHHAARREVVWDNIEPVEPNDDELDEGGDFSYGEGGEGEFSQDQEGYVSQAVDIDVNSQAEGSHADFVNFGPTSNDYTPIVISTHGQHSQTNHSGEGRNVSNYINGRGGENSGFSIGHGGGLGHLQERDFIEEMPEEDLHHSRFNGLDFLSSLSNQNGGNGMSGFRDGGFRVPGSGVPLQKSAGVSGGFSGVVGDAMGGFGWSGGVMGCTGGSIGLGKVEFRGDHGGLGLQGQVEMGSQRRESFGGHGGAVGEVEVDVQVGPAIHGRGNFSSSRIVQGSRQEPVVLEDFENVQTGLSLNAQSYFH